MAYNEGDIATNPDTGESVQFTGGAWVPMGSPVTLGGAAKALGSGLIHKGIPGILGAPSDIADIGAKGIDWATNKITNALGMTKEPEDASVPTNTPAPTSVVTSASAPLTDRKIKGSTKELVEASAPAKSNILPGSEDINKAVSSIVPEYQPKNFVERVAKRTGEFVPGMIAAPEAEGANLMAQALRSGARYAFAPALASESSREIPYVKGSAIEEPLAMATALAAGPLATKIITPNPASAINRYSASVLDRQGATYTPKQLSGGNLDLEGAQANALGTGTSARTLNAQNENNYTRGALRAVTDPLPDAVKAAPIPSMAPGVRAAPLTEQTTATPQVLNHIDQAIDSEFNRLTGRRDPTKPLGIIWDTKTQKEFKPIMKEYEANKIVKDQDPAVQQAYDKIQSLLTPTSGSHWIDADKYQVMRSELGDLAQHAAGPPEARAFSQMQSTLDNSMRRVFNHFYPDDAESFDNVRKAYVNNLILKRALPVGSHGVVTPDNLANATSSILGHDKYLNQAHPVAQYSDAGQRLLGDKLPEAANSHIGDNVNLGLLFAGSGLSGHGMADALAGHVTPATAAALGITAASAARVAGRPVVGRMLNSEIGRKYLSNQMLPQEAQPVFTQNPANAAVMAEMLRRGKNPSDETKP